LFINVVVESVAFVLFLVVKGINSMKKQQGAATAAPQHQQRKTFS